MNQDMLTKNVLKGLSQCLVAINDSGKAMLIAQSSLY